MVPSWNGNDCDACIEFTSGFPRGGGAYLNVSSEAMIGEWEEQAVLQASDRRSGDRFGASLGLDQVTHETGKTYIFCAKTHTHTYPMIPSEIVVFSLNQL